MALVIFATHYYAGPNTKRLSPENMDILNRASGIILVSIAFQLLTKGITELAVDAVLKQLLTALYR